MHLDVLLICCSDEPMGSWQDASHHISNVPHQEDEDVAQEPKSPAATDTSNSDAVSIASLSPVGSAAASLDFDKGAVTSGLVHEISTRANDINISPVDATDISSAGSAASFNSPPSSPRTAPGHSPGEFVAAPLPAAIRQASAQGLAHDAPLAAPRALAHPRPQRPHVGRGAPAVPGRHAPPGALGALHGRPTPLRPAHCHADELSAAWHHDGGVPAATAPKKKR